MSLAFPTCYVCESNPCLCSGVKMDSSYRRITICPSCSKEVSHCTCKQDTGIKYDGEKAEMYLLPPRAILEVGKVLTYGAKKYSPDNWKKLDKLHERYTSAALRHILADMAGEQKDKETDLDHLAHAVCCLLFRLEARLQDETDQEEGPRKP